MSKVVTMQDLKAHGTKDDFWILVNGKVYDVTKFLDEHPGGDEVLLHEAGQDATDAFEDVGHSDEARALLPGMVVGEIEGGASKITTSSPSKQSKAIKTSSNAAYFLPLALAGGYFAWRYYNGTA